MPAPEPLLTLPGAIPFARPPAARPRPSRRTLFALLASGLGALAGGCLPGGDGPATGAVGGASAASPPSAAAPAPPPLVATTRRPVSGGTAPPYFNAERGRGLAVAEARLEPPDSSLVGQVTSPLSSGDWRVAGVSRLDAGPGAADAFAHAAFGRDVLLYVHGYRETFASAAAGAAALSDGIRFRGASALFTWPSAAATLDYGYDRESALWSRDALQDLLAALARSPSGGRVHLVAHSMGTLLTLETLRLLRAEGGEGAIARIGAIVLAAPDVDFDLFARGVERLGPDASKITVISSTSDRALALSSRLAGGVVRAGAADRGRLEALGVRVADASEYGGGLVNHDLFLSDPEVQQVVARAVERAGGGAS